MGCKVEIKSSLRKKLDAIQVRGAMFHAAQTTARKTSDGIKKEIEDQKLIKTGNMMRSTNHEIIYSDDMVEVLVKNNTKYWPYVNFGTSKINARHFVENAVNKVNPSKVMADEFRKNYKIK